jgi:hypothetical protein
VITVFVENLHFENWPGIVPAFAFSCREEGKCSSFVPMHDFSKPYRKVTYFGLWADDTADDYGKRDAMAILADAARRCFDEDMRQRQELQNALDYLARATSRAVYLNRFRKALDEPDPAVRFRAARDAYNAPVAPIEGIDRPQGCRDRQTAGLSGAESAAKAPTAAAGLRYGLFHLSKALARRSCGGLDCLAVPLGERQRGGLDNPMFFTIFSQASFLSAFDRRAATNRENHHARAPATARG